jgi:hypothetical protein
MNKMLAQSFSVVLFSLVFLIVGMGCTAQTTSKTVSLDDVRLTAGDVITFDRYASTGSITTVGTTTYTVADTGTNTSFDEYDIFLVSIADKNTANVTVSTGDMKFYKKTASTSGLFGATAPKGIYRIESVTNNVTANYPVAVFDTTSYNATYTLESVTSSINIVLEENVIDLVTYTTATYTGERASTSNEVFYFTKDILVVKAVRRDGTMLIFDSKNY